MELDIEQRIAAAFAVCAAFQHRDEENQRLVAFEYDTQVGFPDEVRAYGRPVAGSPSRVTKVMYPAWVMAKFALGLPIADPQTTS